MGNKMPLPERGCSLPLHRVIPLGLGYVRVLNALAHVWARVVLASSPIPHAFLDAGDSDLPPSLLVHVGRYVLLRIAPMSTCSTVARIETLESPWLLALLRCRSRHNIKIQKQQHMCTGTASPTP